jgi:methyl-accepting chemotaxis protein
MLNWFENHAPIRVKFRALLALYGTIGAAMAAAAVYAANHATGVNALVIEGVAIGGACLLIGVTALASKLVCGPYVSTVVRMEALAAGDLESPILYTANGDCVGRMTKAMSIFRTKMEEAMVAANQEAMAESLATGLQKLSQGDLSHRISIAFPPQYESLRSDFNNAMDELSATLGAVSEASGGVHTGASEISQASNDLSRRTEQQAASLEETAAAMDEITTTVREAAASAARANKAVIQARQEAEHSGTVVSRAIDAMGGIERSSTEISEIISVIDGIAFQTNLLALNAGVEAARAGDAGKGFAVVASEVRALAQRSADAAKDVKARITASSQQVDAGVSLVSETGAALQRIITSIGEIDGLVAGIATSAEQQASGLQQVNSAVAEMDGVTQQNAAMVEQATAASRSLAAEADALAAQIGRFTLGGHAAPRQHPQAANTVHKLQARASRAQRSLPRSSASSSAAVALADDDWSEF